MVLFNVWSVAASTMVLVSGLRGKPFLVMSILSEASSVQVTVVGFVGNHFCGRAGYSVFIGVISKNKVFGKILEDDSGSIILNIVLETCQIASINIA